MNIRPGSVATRLGRAYPARVLGELARRLGIDAEFPGGRRFPEELTEQLQQRAQAFFLADGDVARAVMFAIEQPPHVDFVEITLRPRKVLPL